MKRNIFLILAVLFLTLSQAAVWQSAVCAQAEGNYRDPFDSLLPAPPLPPKNNQPGIRGNIGQSSNVAANTEAKPLKLSIEGVLWGTDKPSAIINGQVYKIGDTLKDMDVKIYDIQKNKVLIVYEGRLQGFGVNVLTEDKKDTGGHGSFNKR
jgi:hypothetical protein